MSFFFLGFSIINKEGIYYINKLERNNNMKKNENDNKKRRNE